MESDVVRAIGIWGMGGIGKTTIAKAFYNRYCNKFDISCFSVNVKQHSRGGSSLLQLLQQLLIDLLRKKDYKIPDVESGIRKLTHILHSKRALIVLDDLDCANYSELLASIGNLFPAGSKIIITTRDANLLNKLKADISEVDTYMVKTLRQSESLKLFSYHAFRKPVPPGSFKELSLNFVTHAGGLPLALKVLGSSLLGRTDESFWKEKLEKVKAIPENDIQKILQLSYDELEDETQKKIFLDIAFFFVGKNKDEATDVFKSCDFFPGVGIQNLVDRCLLTVDEFNRFEMHNLIQDMGRELGKTTHLFLRGNAWKSLQNPEPIKQMNYLTCLNLGICSGLKRLPEELGDMKALKKIDTSFTALEKLPDSITKLKGLITLKLGGCKKLRKLPEEIGNMEGLEYFLADISAIEQLPDSFGGLINLVELSLTGCKKLRNLPNSICKLKLLINLYVDGCLNLEQLPEQLGKMQCLERLNACFTDSIGLPGSLKSLDLGDCEKLKFVPKSIWNLTSIKQLSLYPGEIGFLDQLRDMHGLKMPDASGTAIEQLPDSFCRLVNLVQLNLRNCENLTSLPSCIWKLKFLHLQIPKVHECTRLQDLPDLSSLKELENLSITGCSKVKSASLRQNLLQGHCRTVPLSKQWAYYQNLKKHQSVKQLVDLRSLDMGGCSIMEWLPDQIGEMKGLKTIDVSCTAIEQLPDSITRLREVEELKLSGCKKLRRLPEHIGNIEFLRIFDANCSGIEQLPESFGKTGNIDSVFQISHFSPYK
ncbi:hypothetical protein AgCh_015036 [Apium graveolens]